MVDLFRWTVFGCFAAIVGVTTACDTRDVIEENYRDITSHEAYALSLRQAGLGENAVVDRWTAAAYSAIQQPLWVDSPFEESGVVSPTEPRALGFRVEARRGQRLVVDVAFEGIDDGRVFVDLFRQRGDTTGQPFHEAATGLNQSSLDYSVPRSGTFIVRVQPELLYGGTYALSIRVLPSLAFPVQDRGPSAILSRFGASREGGRRSHKGVDIFAPRGTPALAAASGRVSRVDTTRLGGNVVWLRDDRSRNSLYYAHLERPTVEEGQRVEPGDTVGLVGNSGNARTTPPHLHFGIYRRREGALDPFAFIEPQDSAFAEHTASDTLVGRWVRSNVTASVRTGADRSAPVLVEVASGTAARVLGRSGGWLRVQLPDQSEGYALANQITSVEGAVAGATAEESTPRMEPRRTAPAIAASPEWTSREVLAHFDGFGMVRASDGRIAWVELDDSK